MKKMKRWLALVLAIALVSTNAIYQLGTHMSASESSQDTSVSEEQPQQEEQAADSQTQDTTEHTDSGQASVQEVTPDQSATATTQQAADVQQAADAQQTEAAQTEAAQTDVAKTIAVKIQKSDVDGGTVKVVNADGSKSDVTYDGNNQYAKEVTEGESFGFEVTAKDGYQVEQVTDQNGTAIQPASVNGNVSTYNITDIRSERVFSILYKEASQSEEQVEDSKAEEKSDEEQKESDATDESSKPECTLSQTVDGTTITVKSPEGALEEGWTLEVKKVSAKSVKSAIEGAVEDADAIEEIKAFDITIYDKDGNAIQPDGSVQVSFSGTGIKGDAAEVYHVDDSKKKAEKVCDATTNSKVEFEAEHFSIYAVVGSNTVYANTKDTAYEVAIGDQLTLKSDNYKKDQEWKSDESSIVKVVDSGTTGWMNPQPYAIVEAKSEGTTFVKYNKEKFYITVTKSNGTLSFDLNGGTGTKPADITGENGESVTLPTGNEITRENYTFLGWSTEKDANLVTSNGKAVVYPAGGTFEVSGKTTLYAVWAQSAGKLSGKIAIAIRKDGTIPGEPSLQYASYTFLTSSRGNSTLMSVDNVLDYINPAQTMVGKSNVESVLQPTFYSYVNNKNANGTYWNNATQYVEWYVVKYQNSDYAYHIDGVVRNKQNVYLDYDGNGYTDGLVPNGVQLVEGGSTTVSQAGNYYNGNSDWRDLKKAGYTFIGWNTSADGKGTSYQPGASITVRENTTLYAQWKAKGYTVKYDSDGGSAVADKNLKFADEVDVSATPTKDGYIFKGWYYNESEVKDATYASLVNDDESVQEITLKAKWQQKDGRFGYYLSLASADWKGGMPDNLEVSGTSGQGLPKYAEKVHYTYGDKYNVISNVPEAEGHAFIGWLDKKRGNQSAAIRTAGDELTYIYKAGDENQAYTLDALWASIAAKGGTYPYNGSSRQITADVAINEGLNLNAEYVEQAKKFIKTGKMEYSTDNKNWSEENPGFTDAGTYTVYVRQDVTVGGTTTTLQSSAQIVINPRSVELTSATDSKMYDGKALTKKEVTVSGDGFIEGEGATYNVTGSQKVVGSSENTFTYTLTDATKAQNYHITMHNGTLTVTNRDAKYEITVEANRTTETYDGTEYSAVGLKTTTFNVNGEEYTVSGLTTQDPKQKNAGTYTNNITGTAIVKDAEGNDVTDQFLVKTSDGSLVIKKAEVTLKSATLTKQYDGDALVNGNTALEIESGWAEGEGAEYHFTGSQTLVGSSENTFTYTAKAGTNFNNYTIKPSNGTLTVTNRDAKYEITVKANSTKATYDGKKHKAEGVETYEFTINNHKYTVSGLKTEDPEHKNAGTYTNNITGTAVVTDEAGNDVSSEFLVKTEDGSLKINKAKVTLKSADLNKKYDGKALVNGDKALATETGWAEGEGADYTFTGSQTLVGSSANSFTYKAKAGTNFNNYEITANSGTLTVTSRDAKYEITVKANSTTGTYNGTEYSATGLESTTFTVDGNVYTVEGLTTEDPVKKDAGTYTNNITGTAVVKDAAGNDVSSEFAVSTENGSLKIKKAEVTLKSATLTKQYDGDALVNGTTALETEEGWTEADKDSVVYNFTGSQTYVGSSENTFSVVWNETVKESNYNVAIDYGTLTVTDGTPENPVDPSLVVNKTHDKNQTYKAGNTITFTITVKNIYDEVKTITLAEQEGVTLDNAEFANVQPGAEITATARYTVTEADIVNGTFTNNVTVTFSGVDKEYVGTDTVEEFEDSNPHMAITKKTTGVGENHIYKLGETINYEITVTNDGNLTLTNVTVEDELTGNTGRNAWTIDTFAPGETKTFKTSYTVTEADLGKTVVNVATATGKTPDPDKPKPGVDPGKTEDPTDPKKPSMSIDKTVIDRKDEYQIGDTVKYEITVTNDGNTTQNNILVEDQMNAAGQAVITKVEGANGTIDGTNVTLDTLAPDKSATITVEYTVVKADRGNKITNAAVAKGEGENPETPEIPVDVEDVYDIHVVHAFAPDNEGDVTLPADYTIENLKPGTTKDLIAEAVTGYVAYPGTQNATIIDGDITVTFLYYKDEIGTDPKNPDQPDGVPDEFQRVVRFAAVNGTVSIDHAVVTLYGEDGKPAKNGVGHLSAEQIAAATANTGYDQSSLRWSPATPTSSYDITDEMTFTATFTATPAVPNTPNTPAPPATPNPPATPSDNPGVLDRVVDTIKDVAADVQEVFSSDDGDVPLANQNLDEHKCCILHFLIMLLTAILYGFFTHNMKKRQKKNFELREELDTELVKRGLPTSKEQKNS